MKVFSKALSIALIASFGMSAFASSATVGTLGNIKGLVNVSQNGLVTAVSTKTNLIDGSVVLNSANGSSIVSLNNGCTVELKSNQVFTVKSTGSCADMLSSVKAVGADDAAFDPWVVGALAVGGAAIIYNVTKTKNSGS